MTTTTTNEWSTLRQDWGHGLQTSAAICRTINAVLGVESGPVTIEYMDTDGRTRTLRIEIDNQPPAIQVTTRPTNRLVMTTRPTSTVRSKTPTPVWSAESFRLVVDNDSDGEKNTKYVVNGPPAPTR